MAAKKPNLGRDLTLSFSVNGQVILELGLYTDVHFKPVWSEKKIVPINNGGIPVARSIYGGHDVEIQFGRRDSTGEQLAQFLQDNYTGGGSEPNVTLTEIVKDDDGSFTSYQYIDGIVYPTDLGSFKATDEVMQTFKFFFAQRIQLGTGLNSPTLSGATLASVASTF